MNIPYVPSGHTPQSVSFCFLILTAPTETILLLNLASVLESTITLQKILLSTPKRQDDQWHSLYGIALTDICSHGTFYSHLGASSLKVLLYLGVAGAGHANVRYFVAAKEQ